MLTPCVQNGVQKINRGIILKSYHLGIILFLWRERRDWSLRPQRGIPDNCLTELLGQSYAVNKGIDSTVTHKSSVVHHRNNRRGLKCG